MSMGTCMDAKRKAAAEGVACECGDSNRSTLVGTVMWAIYVSQRVFADGATVLTATLNVLSPTTFVIMAAVATRYAGTGFTIERPLGTNITDQSTVLVSSDLQLFHGEACERLAAGNYTWFLVNRSGAGRNVLATWMKVRAVT